MAVYNEYKSADTSGILKYIPLVEKKGFSNKGKILLTP